MNNTKRNVLTIIWNKRKRKDLNRNICLIISSFCLFATILHWSYTNHNKRTMVAILLVSHLHSYILKCFNLVFPNYLDNSVIWWILEYNMEFLLEEIIESTSYLCHTRYHENMSQSEYFMAYLFTNHSPFCCVHTATLLNILN
jgi:hypothetical protein